MKALIFDLDDTLYPEHDFVLSGFRAVDRYLHRTHRVEGFFAAAAALFGAGRRGDIFDAALRLLGFAHDAPLIQSLVDVYRGHTPTITLHDDARWAIELFRETCPLGLLTDGFLETQRRKVAALGLTDTFDAIVYSDAFGRHCWKPSPVPYLKAMESLRLADCGYTYVSDNPLKDFVTPNRLGWATVRICRAGQEHAAVVGDAHHAARVTISSLYDLPGVL